MPFLTPPLTFIRIEPWTLWQAPPPYPLSLDMKNVTLYKKVQVLKMLRTCSACCAATIYIAHQFLINTVQLFLFRMHWIVINCCINICTCFNLHKTTLMNVLLFLGCDKNHKESVFTDNYCCCHSNHYMCYSATEIWNF